MVLQCQEYMLKEKTFQEILVPLEEKMNIRDTHKGSFGSLNVFCFFVFRF